MDKALAKNTNYLVLRVFRRKRGCRPIIKWLRCNYQVAIDTRTQPVGYILPIVNGEQPEHLKFKIIVSHVQLKTYKVCR